MEKSWRAEQGALVRIEAACVKSSPEKSNETCRQVCSCDVCMNAFEDHLKMIPAAYKLVQKQGGNPP
jgi:hypothetical protein